jgi:hypothetical protein
VFFLHTSEGFSPKAQAEVERYFWADWDEDRRDQCAEVRFVLVPREHRDDTVNDIQVWFVRERFPHVKWGTSNDDMATAWFRLAGLTFAVVIIRRP